MPTAEQGIALAILSALVGVITLMVKSHNKANDTNARRFLKHVNRLHANHKRERDEFRRDFREISESSRKTIEMLDETIRESIRNRE